MADTLPTMRNWYEIRNAAADTAEVFIYDDIGAGWFTEGVTAKGFLNELADIKAPRIDLHLNSPGGSVFDGVAIYNALKRHPATVTTYIDGLAASIASIIALAGDRVVMADNALFMIHNPWGGVQGEAKDMRKMADVLDQIKSTLIGTYTSKTGLDEETVSQAMDEETWYTAQDALEAGFIDEVGVELQVAASFSLEGRGFKHAPMAAVEQPEADPVDPVVEHPDSSTDGASVEVASDGASEPQPEAAATFVDGIGFINFNRKR